MSRPIEQRHVWRTPAMPFAARVLERVARPRQRVRVWSPRAMHQRYHDRDGESSRTRSRPPQPRDSADPVLALQRAIGNRETARVLAREQDKNRPSFEHSVRIGKFGPIEITGGNIADWVAKKDPEGLIVTSVEGKHSEELKRLHESKARIDSVETASVVGENTLVTIAFKNARVRRYSADGKTEEWMIDFDTVKRHSTSIGTAR